jgi:hypothetical protein
MGLESAIERKLEPSAEAQIKRREAAEDFPAFHNLTGAAVAYARHLAFCQNSKQSKPNSLD